MARILIIDDDEQVVKLLDAFLESSGHDVTTARDGAKGISLLDGQQFDLVITDIVMPERDGLEVLLHLKNRPDRPKVIAISGGTLSMDKEHLLKLSSRFSADALLAKPFPREELLQAINQIIKS